MIIALINKFKLNKLFKSDDSRFILLTASKVSLVYFFTVVLVAYLVWLILSLNNIFFEANGFINFTGTETVFFDLVVSSLLQSAWYVMTFLILLFFAGVYLAKILLRPFAIIGQFCEEAAHNKSAIYNPDLFSDFKLLTRFSEFFFQYIADSRLNKKFNPGTIPPTFTKVRGPVFDRVFFFHCFLFVSMISICSSIFITSITVEIYNSIVELAIHTLPKSGNEVAYFLKNEQYLFRSIQYITILTLVTSYIFISFHIYGKVSGAVFGFFSTMRSFMKGNRTARIHLVGYPHIRPYSRAFNKYLDLICREIEDDIVKE